MQLNLLTNFVITHTDSIKDLEVHFCTTFFFQSLKMWDSYIYMGAQRDFFVHQSWRIEQKREANPVSLHFSLPFPHVELC